MKIAKYLREDNICEHLLYMWQVEDTLRAYGLDEERIQREYVSRFGLPEDEARETAEWYANLVRMMCEEGCQEKGHLQINQGTLSMLSDLHAELLRSMKHAYYSAAYYKALPFIVELRAKGDKEVGEVETCLNCLYGVMLLRAQHREISSETTQALEAISHLMGMLADAWRKDKAGELEI